GNPTPTTVQWLVSTNGGTTFTPITGATSTTLTLTNTTASQNGSEYEAVFSNANGLSAPPTSPATLTVKVTAATTTTLTASASSSVFGQAVTFTATVKAVPPATGSPTGSVTFMDGSITLGTEVLSTSGKATLTTKALPAGQDTITAVYSGDTNFATSTSAAVNQLVNKDSTSMTKVSSTANPSVYGQSVTFSTTVQAMTPGSGVPTGPVTFYDGPNTVLGTATLNSSGVARFKNSGLAPGSYTITASYLGDSNFMAPTTAPAALSQTVNKDNTTTTILSSPNPSSFGQSVTFTATVKAAAPGSGVPTGTVTFYDGSPSQGTPLGTAMLYGSGQATIPIGTLSVGSHTITAMYSGDTNFIATLKSDPATTTQTVNPAATKTTVVSSANPSSFGQSVTFTATVSVTGSGSGTPTGSVNFYLDGSTTPLYTAPLTSAGSASFPTSALAVPLAVGSQSITAVYEGDGNFAASPRSTPLNETVTKDATTTSLTSSASSSTMHGQSVTFTATVTPVSPGNGTPTGNVTFTITSNGKTLSSGVAPLMAMSNGADEAMFPYTFSTAGTYSITAVYAGNTDFTKSTSAPFKQTVT